MMNWYNQPPQWNEQDESMTVQVGAKTDFWRLTHSGAVSDNGHFYYQVHEGDFQAQVTFSGQYATLYDQAGLMVRIDEKNWLKCGIEMINDIQHASAVVTRDYSDWSVVALPTKPTALWLRVKREGITIEVSYSLDGERYQLLRQAYFPPVPSVQVGLMCASPLGPGFSVTFDNFTVEV
jgi:regulation of enolase protein 1 (concanavalin A-like superfamily)